MKCDECHGSGKIILLTSVTKCKACGGTGTKAQKKDEPKASLTMSVSGSTATVTSAVSGWTITPGIGYPTRSLAQVFNVATIRCSICGMICTMPVESGIPFIYTCPCQQNKP